MNNSTKHRLALGLIAVVVAGIAPLAATAAAPPNAAVGVHTPSADDAAVRDQLAQVRRATARFHNVDAARRAGYELGWVNGSGERIITGCVSHPTAGAMGFHYFNAELMADLAVDLLQPEVLVYEPGPRGRLRLVAVEWVARGAASNPPGVSEPPTVLGMPMHILVPQVGFYITHAWIWKPNPAGMFADWNPAVTCP
jgi:hypothetical protein